MDMKSALICILLFMLGISVESANAETVLAEISDYDFPSGDWYRGNDQDDVHVWIKNTGDVGHLFWVSYSVMDRRGQWYSAPPQSIYAEPGDDTWFVSPVWSIPDDAEIGDYQAEFAIYSYYDSNTGELLDLLDQVDQASAFSVVG